ncbi:diphthine synthase [Candidatus Pacearchaeota archaeon]|nr:diphthine synthase [Candidatus Pacearchaeota archaeon]
MLYLIGLGLDSYGISKQGLDIIKKAKKIYLETYTVDFPYNLGWIEDVIDKKVVNAGREKVESLELVDEAAKQDVVLLVYGSPLTATTHITLIQECKASGVKYKVIHNASILDAVAETGLQLYKFGKTTSMPTWKKSFEPTSFIEVVKDNMKIDAHSLILVDIGLNLATAIDQLELSAKKEGVKLDKIIVASKLGADRSKIIYNKIENFRDFDIERPYCIIIPGKLHFVESNFLENL